jgi:hypothetical protein
MCLECTTDHFKDAEGACVETCGDSTYVLETPTMDYCMECPEGCVSCDSWKVCTEAEKGYELVEETIPLEGGEIGETEDISTAMPCEDPNCLDCAEGMCVECIEDLFIDIDGVCVISCGLAHFDIDTVCTACHEGCRICQDTETCDTCYKGYNLDENDACVACSEHCLDCLNNECTECDRGWQIAEDFTCEECEENCDHCEADTCLECTDTFFNDAGSCTADCGDARYGSADTGSCETCPQGCS